MKELQAIVRALNSPTSTEAVLATLVSVEGSSYRRPGARLLVLADGRRIGGISGGCLEEDVRVRARRVAASRQPDIVVYDTTSENDLVWGVGLGCHGIVRIVIEPLAKNAPWVLRLAENFAARRSTRLAVAHRGPPDRLGTGLAADPQASTNDVYVETIRPPTHLVVFGAGDDAGPLVRLAKELGWVVTVADPRPALATAERFPAADRLVTGAAPELPAQAGLDADSVAVVMTHHYLHDLPLLQALSRAPVAYLGLLGPRKRAERILAELAGGGAAFPGEPGGRLHAPIGLDLGAEGPEQVALSIVAEIQSVLAGRSGRPLRERARPIHTS